jgi:hypothetical protein
MRPVGKVRGFRVIGFFWACDRRFWVAETVIRGRGRGARGTEDDGCEAGLGWTASPRPSALPPSAPGFPLCLVSFLFGCREVLLSD